MHVNILTNKDIEAIALVSGLYSYKNMHSLLREYAKTNVPKGEDLEATISSEFLPSTYTYNPSLLAQKVRGQLGDTFKSSSGSILSGEGRVKVLLFREPRARYERHHEKPSVKQIIKEWVNLTVHHDIDTDTGHLDVPTSIIPRFLFTHPEQLAYQIKCETGSPIKIQRFKTLWRITLK